MDLLTAFRTFARVAESGSFSAVAREMGATQPAISRQVAALEEHLSVRLIQRTTRSLTLTEDGRDLLAHVHRVLDAVEEAEAAVGSRRGAPAGLVRLTAPATFGRRYIAPRIGALLALYPELSVELSLNDGPVDLVAEGLDLAIRIGEVEDASLVARRVGSTSRAVIASRDYLQQHGEPAHPDDLANHPCIIFLRYADPLIWRFAGPQGAAEVRISGRFRTDSGEAVREGILAGLGIGLLPAWILREELKTGAVKTILRKWQPPRSPIHAVYPSRRHLAPRTRAVIDFLVDEFRLDPVITTYGEA